MKIFPVGLSLFLGLLLSTHASAQLLHPPTPPDCKSVAAGGVVVTTVILATSSTSGGSTHINSGASIIGTTSHVFTVNHSNHILHIDGTALGILQAGSGFSGVVTSSGVTNLEVHISTGGGISVTPVGSLLAIDASAGTNSNLEVDNTGAIGGRSGGILGDVVTITNNAAGTIRTSSGRAIMINGGGASTVANSGAIGTVTGDIGIEGQQVAITNNGGATIQGITAQAILINADSSASSINNSGTITGATVGIQGQNVAITNNTGDAITGTAAQGILISSHSSASSINNAGTITGGTIGIQGQNVTITNSAAGTITGTAAEGILISAGTSSVDNSGNITGATTGILGSSSAETVIHRAGTITGTGGTAIDLAGGNDSLRIEGGTLTGNVDGGTGTDTLTFAGSFTTTSVFSNIEQVDALSGTIRLNAASTLPSVAVSGGTFGGTGVLTITNLTVSGGATDFDGNSNITNVTVSGGTFGGSGVLTVSNLTLTSGTTDLDGNSNITSAALSGGTLGGSGTLTVGTLTASSGQSTVSATTIITSAVINSGALTGSGTMTATNLTVNGGTFFADGAITVTNPLQVNSGGTLGGSGTITGDVTINSGGLLEPGNSPGTITIDGDLTLSSGSILRTELQGDPSKANDLVVILGGANTATLTGATLNLVVGSGVIKTGDTFDILTTANANGVVGTFGTINGSSVVLGLAVSYQADTVRVTATRKKYESFATTPNETVIATTLDTLLDSASGDLASVLHEIDRLESATSVSKALRSLAPETHQVTTAVAATVQRGFFRGMDRRLSQIRSRLETYTYHRPPHSDRLMAMGGGVPTQDTLPPLDTIMDENRRLRAQLARLQRKGIRVWANGLALRASKKETSSEIGYDLSSVGSIFGADYQLNDVLGVGIIGSGVRSQASYRGSRGWTDSESMTLGVYGMIRLGAGGHLDLTAYYGWDSYENERKINFGSLRRAAQSDHDGFHTGTRLAGRYLWQVGRWQVGPTAELGYMRTHQKEFQETGASDLDLRVRSRDIDSLEHILGFQASTRIDLADGKTILVPEFRAGWGHEYMREDGEIKSSFRGAASQSFTVKSPDPDRDRATLGVGLRALLRENLNLQLHYDTSLGGEHESTHSLQFGLTLRF